MPRDCVSISCVRAIHAPTPTRFRGNLLFQIISSLLQLFSPQLERDSPPFRAPAQPRKAFLHWGYPAAISSTSISKGPLDIRLKQNALLLSRAICSEALSESAVAGLSFLMLSEINFSAARKSMRARCKDLALPLVSVTATARLFSSWSITSMLRLCA